MLDRIREAAAADALRGVSLLETFFACCHEKAEEVDDSDGELGRFVEDLVCEWIKTKQAAAGDPASRVERLLVWIDDDPYGFCSQMDRKAVDVLDVAAAARVFGEGMPRRVPCTSGVTVAVAIEGVNNALTSCPRWNHLGSPSRLAFHGRQRPVGTWAEPEPADEC